MPEAKRIGRNTLLARVETIGKLIEYGSQLAMLEAYNAASEAIVKAGEEAAGLEADLDEFRQRLITRKGGA